jgi:hypothetical protein
MENKLYENKMGTRIEIIDTNKDAYNNKYITWRFADTDRSYNVSKESFKNMIKANGYKEVK